MAERTDRHGWIDLLVPDGPFLSAGALDVQTVGENWPTRLSGEQRGLLLAPTASESDDGEGWDDSTWDGRRDRVRTLLTELLGYREGNTLSVAPKITAHHHIYRARINADFAIHAPDDPDDVRVVVICGPDATDDPARIQPSRTHNHDGWVSTPVQRAALLARHAGADLALVTNGREHLLVNVVTGTTGSAIWTVNGLEDRQARDAFVALLHKQRVLHRQTSLSRLIELSQDRQHELTDTLGKQVRRAAEALVNAVSRANRTSRGRLLEGVSGQQVYAATTRILMRSVFLLVAEERGLLPVAENQLYADQYAMSTLLDKLEEDAYRNRSAMERRAGAWLRMMALSRAVHAGIEHDDLRLPAYGGNLFDPEEHPFLEARVRVSGDEYEHLDVGVVDDFTVLTVLRHLQIAHGQRISFRSLDVEQIGHVYEALLDHSAVIVEDDQVAVLGLVGKAGDEPEIPLVELEAWTAKSDKELGKQLADIGVAAEARGVYNAMEAGLAPDSEVAQTLNVAVANDAVLRERVEPYAPLLRTDARGVALVFLPGDVYVTETSSKRDSGTAYTPRSLADEIAKHTLDPLIYDPGPQNESDESKWKLKTPDEILDLKICDPAVGSAAILVAAVRYLAEALLQARVGAGELSPEALASGAVDNEAVDARVHARRNIVARCVYGVDRDPMAVEMAKLSLWLVTMARDEPFTFLDHAIRHGDSLVGLSSIEQLRQLHLDASADVFGLHRDGLFADASVYAWQETIDAAVNEVVELRQRLQSTPVRDVKDAASQEALFQRAQRSTALLRQVADAVVGTCLRSAAEDEGVTAARLSALAAVVGGASTDLTDWSSAQPTLAGIKDVDVASLHWPLEFPEVFSRPQGRFDAIVANPPFKGSQDISGILGSNYREHLVRYVADGRRGKADLVAYFAIRIAELSERAGFLATNSIAQGQSRSVGLQFLSDEEIAEFYRADRSVPWPGEQGVTVSKIWMSRSKWGGDFVLDGESGAGRITASLERAGRLVGTPMRLAENAGLCFQGYQVISHSMELSADVADALTSADPKSADVIACYLNGDALNGPPPRATRTRQVIDFGVMSEAEARKYRAVYEYAFEHVRPEVIAKASPRDDGRPSSYARWADRWWQYWSPRPKLRHAIRGKDQVLALVLHSSVVMAVLVPAKECLTHGLAVFALDDMSSFSALNSSLHWWWAVSPPGTGGSSLGSAPRYTPTTTFQTFPRPRDSTELQARGSDLNEHREKWLSAHGIGLTEGYSRINDPVCVDEDVEELRALHVAIDKAVVDSYASEQPDTAWESLDLEHGFYDCGPQGVRFTASPSAREVFMTALLELNYRRYAHERSVSFEQVLRETGNA